MINVEVRGNFGRKAVTVETTATPAEVFESIGMDYSTSMVTLSGEILEKSEVSTKSFADLGVADGSRVTMHAIVKATGANE